MGAGEGHSYRQRLLSMNNNDAKAKLWLRWAVASLQAFETFTSGSKTHRRFGLSLEGSSAISLIKQANEQKQRRNELHLQKNEISSIREGK